MPSRGLARPVRSRFRALVAASAASLLAVGTLVGVTPVAAAEPDLARVGTVSASAEQNDADGSFPAQNAIDGNDTTRWASGNGPDDDVVFTASLTSDPSTISVSHCLLSGAASLANADLTCSMSPVWPTA